MEQMMDPEAMTPAMGSAGGDMTQGYELSLCVYADGTFAVKGPEPLDETGEGGDTLDSIGAALKALLDIVKQNPIGGDAQANFEAGYGSR